MKTCLFCNSTFKSRYHSQRFCSETCANRFNLNGLKKVSLAIKSPELAEFVGVILGDGNSGKYQTRVYLNTIADKEYIIFIKELLEKLFPEVASTVMIRHEEGCTVITLTSRIIVDFFREMGIKSWKPKVPYWIFEKEEYIAACVRGLIDTEGSIGFKIYKGEMKISVYRQLAFTSRNNILLTFVRDSLSILGLNCTQTLIKNIYLSNDKEIDKYRNLVGFHNPKLEKRSLIRNFLEYQNWRGVRGV